MSFALICPQKRILLLIPRPSVFHRAKNIKILKMVNKDNKIIKWYDSLDYSTKTVLIVSYFFGWILGVWGIILIVVVYLILEKNEAKKDGSNTDN